MADETEKFSGGNPLDPNNYAPPEDKYEDMQPQNQAPGVSAPAARNFVFIGVIALVVIVIVYVFFSGGGEKPIPKPKGSGGGAPERLSGPAPVAPPPPIPAPPLPPAPTPVDNSAAQNQAVLFPDDNSERYKRYQSSMLISNGSGLFGGGTNLTSKPQINENDPNVGFADSFYTQGEAPFAQARKLGNTNNLIAQGKIMEAVLETPINTDLPGMIRAIVSRDIYAESGRQILVPKGSRLVGTYNNFIIRGNKRINVIWSRMIRPDGIDIMLRSEGTDQLGRAGIPAEVDNKYAEIFASAFLVSAINIAIGVGVDAIDTARDKQQSTTTNTDGSTTTNSDAKTDAALQAVDLFGSAGQNLLQGFLNQKPTATIDQGTRINVFVNRDLIFPSSLGLNHVQVIQ